MDKITPSSARRLLDSVVIAGLHQQMRTASARASKRHPAGDDATGPGAAAEYRRRHPIRGVGIANTARRLRRAARIEAGEAPLQYGVPGKREQKVLARLAARASS